MNYPIPTHLRKYFVIDASKTGEREVVGIVRCDCGSDIFRTLYVGNRNEDTDKHFVQVVKFDKHWFLRIGLCCSACLKEYLVFDNDFHGWNGYVCTDESVRSIPRPPYQEWGCQYCHSTLHRISLYIQGEDMQFALGEGEDVLTEADWFEGFGWFAINVTCTACGAGPTLIVDYETM